MFEKDTTKSSIEIELEINLIYRRQVMKVDYNHLIWPKCKSIGNYRIKGYYERTIIVNNNPIRIRVLRIKCEDCGRTHAVFFLDFVPYYQLSSIDSNIIYKSNFKGTIYDPDLIKNLKKRYMIFIKRIAMFGISIKETILSITTKYIEARMNSYLQIHRGIIVINSSS